MYNQHRTFPRHQNYRDGDKISCSRKLKDGEFQLTEPCSAKIFIEEAQSEMHSFARMSGNYFPEKSASRKIGSEILTDSQGELNMGYAPTVSVGSSNIDVCVCFFSARFIHNNTITRGSFTNWKIHGIYCKLIRYKILAESRKFMHFTDIKSRNSSTCSKTVFFNFTLMNFQK